MSLYPGDSYLHGVTFKRPLSSWRCSAATRGPCALGCQRHGPYSQASSQASRRPPILEPEMQADILGIVTDGKELCCSVLPIVTPEGVPILEPWPQLPWPAPAQLWLTPGSAGSWEQAEVRRSVSFEGLTLKANRVNKHLLSTYYVPGSVLEDLGRQWTEKRKHLLSKSLCTRKGSYKHYVW